MPKEDKEFMRRVWASLPSQLTPEELARRKKSNKKQAKDLEHHTAALDAEKLARNADQEWGNKNWSSNARKRKLKTARDAMDALDAKFEEREEEESMDPDKRYISFAPSRGVMEAEFAKDAIVCFEDDPDFECLSPTFAAPVGVPDHDIVYPSLEHAFQACKTNDEETREAIANAAHPKDAKGLAAKALKKRSEDFGADFKKNSVTLMDVLLRDKFLRNKELSKKLMATGERQLVHRPPTYDDKFWGETTGKKNERVGKNELGKALVRLRDELGVAERAADGREFWKWVEDRTCKIDRTTREETAFKVSWRRSGTVQYSDVESFEETAEVFCGKHEGKCGLMLDHGSCSRAHAALIRGGRNGFACVVDLGSSHGVWLHRSRLEPERLEPFQVRPLGIGEEIRFGASSRRYRVRIETRLADQRQRELYEKLGDPAQQQQDDTALTVRVSNVPFDAKEADVMSLFADMGDVIVSCTIPRPPRHENDKPNAQGEMPPPPRHKGVAFLRIATARDMIQALSCDGDELLGRKVRVSRADSEDPRDKKRSRSDF